MKRTRKRKHPSPARPSPLLSMEQASLFLALTLVHHLAGRESIVSATSCPWPPGLPLPSTRRSPHSAASGSPLRRNARETPCDVLPSLPRQTHSDFNVRLFSFTPRPPRRALARASRISSPLVLLPPLVFAHPRPPAPMPRARDPPPL